MPFLAPVIAAAVGVGAIGQALISVGLSVAMAVAARHIGPKPRRIESSGRGMRLSLRLDPNAEREIVVGRAAVAGTLVYHKAWGPNGTDNIDLVYALADHECDALEQVQVNGKPVTWNSGNGLVAEFPGMTITFKSGAWTQDAHQPLIDVSGGGWTANHRGRGVCYVHVRMSYNQALYQSGLPRFLFILRGAKLYDWRLDSTAGGAGSHRWGQPETYAWSANPAVILYNYRRGIMLNGQRVAGMNTPASAMPTSEWTAAANACDEAVGLKAGGTEPRYRAHGVLSTAQAHRETISDLLTAMAGREITSGGLVKPLAGVAQATVMTFTDADLMTDAPVEIEPKRSRKDLINAVFGSYHDAANAYESIAAPPRISLADEATDGGLRLEEHYALDMVTSPGQAQRVLEILRRRARRQAEGTVTLRARYGVLEAGDWVSWTSDRYGFVAQPFEVVTATVDAGWTVTLRLREVGAADYAWTPASDELDPASPAPVTPGVPSVDRVTGLSVAGILVESQDTTTQRPGLRALWTAISDRTVTEIRFEYRKLGDTGILTYTHFDASTGQAAWMNGIMGETAYEVRALPVSVPPRAMVWSSWVATPAVTEPQVISAVPLPDSVGPAELDAQTRFELSLSTAISDVLGSAGAQAQAQLDAAHLAGEAALRGLITESDVRVVSKQWTVLLDVGGRVVGRIKLDGTETQSSFEVEVDTFKISKPAVNGGAPSTVFAVGMVDGVNAIVFNGNLYADGAIQARSLSVISLSAITANLGTITAGRLQSADNKVWFDLGAKELVMQV